MYLRQNVCEGSVCGDPPSLRLFQNWLRNGIQDPDFLSGTTPWVTLGLSFPICIMDTLVWRTSQSRLSCLCLLSGVLEPRPRVWLLTTRRETPLHLDSGAPVCEDGIAFAPAPAEDLTGMSEPRRVAAVSPCAPPPNEMPPSLCPTFSPAPSF